MLLESKIAQAEHNGHPVTAWQIHKRKKKGMVIMNKDLQMLAMGKGVKQWQLAAEIGVAESTFCRMLRRELTPEMKEKVLAAINKLANAGK